LSTPPPVDSAGDELPAPPPGLPPPPPGGVAPPLPGEIAPTRTGPKGLPAVGWSIWEAVLIGLVTNLLFAQTVVGVIAFLVLGVTSADDPKSVSVGLIVDIAWLLAMVAWLAYRHTGWREQLGIRFGSEGGRNALFGFIAGLILYPVIAIAVGLPLTILFSALSGEEATTPDQLPQHLTGALVVASVILAVFVAPIAEETYFRGILFRSIRDRHGFWPGALISGVIFGLVHWVPSPWQDAVLLQSIMVFTGIALAWIYERRGSLLANVAAHMAFNLIGIVLILRFS
jgi:membrane protease YdiL (CAAX protease family)